MKLLSTLLAKDGILHLATDWQDYADHMLVVLEAAPEFENLSGPGQFTPPDLERTKSKFQRRGERLGHGLWELRYQIRT